MCIEYTGLERRVTYFSYFFRDFPDGRTCECVLMVAASTQNVVNWSHASVSFPEPNPADAAAAPLLARD